SSLKAWLYVVKFMWTTQIRCDNSADTGGYCPDWLKRPPQGPQSLSYRPKTTMTEDQLEQEALGWLAHIGYTLRSGPHPAHDRADPQRVGYTQVIWPGRLRNAIDRLNPHIPASAREDAFKQVENLDTPVQLAANRTFHKLLTNGVNVEYQKDGETRGDFVRLIDWANPQNNEFWAVSQFTLKGPHHTRRPDIILFINGLPLVLIELKNAVNEDADIWKAYDQIQTYKEQIPDVF